MRYSGAAAAVAAMLMAASAPAAADEAHEGSVELVSSVRTATLRTGTRALGGGGVAVGLGHHHRWLNRWPAWRLGAVVSASLYGDLSFRDGDHTTMLDDSFIVSPSLAISSRRLFTGGWSAQAGAGITRMFYASPRVYAWSGTGVFATAGGQKTWRLGGHGLVGVGAEFRLESLPDGAQAWTAASFGVNLVGGWGY